MRCLDLELLAKPCAISACRFSSDSNLAEFSLSRVFDFFNSIRPITAIKTRVILPVSVRSGLSYHRYGHPWPAVKVSIFPQLQHPIACTIASYLASIMGRGKIGADRLIWGKNSMSVCDDIRPLQIEQ